MGRLAIRQPLSRFCNGEKRDVFLCLDQVVKARSVAAMLTRRPPLDYFIGIIIMSFKASCKPVFCLHAAYLIHGHEDHQCSCFDSLQGEMRLKGMYSQRW